VNCFFAQELFQKLDVDQSGWHGYKSIHFVIITFALMSQPLATTKTNHSFQKHAPCLFFWLFGFEGAFLSMSCVVLLVAGCRS